MKIPIGNWFSRLISPLKKLLRRVGFVPGMRLWISLFLITAILATYSIIYQASTFVSNNQYLAWEPADAPAAISTTPYTTTMRLAYPTVARFADDGRPLSIWFEAATPVTYTIQLIPSNDNLLFTDNEGEPAPVSIKTQGQPEQQPVVVYVRRAPLAQASGDITTVQVRVSAPGQPPTNALSFSVEIEDSQLAFRRRFTELLLAPAVLGFLLTLGYRLWDDEKKRREQRQDQITQKINQLRSQTETNLSGAVIEWQRYRQGVAHQEEWPAAAERQWRDFWREEIQKRPWKQALLQTAVKKIKDNQPDEAKKTLEIIHENTLSTAPAQLEHAVELATAHCGQNDQKLNDLLTAELPDTLAALVWMYEAFGVDVDALIEQVLSQPQQIKTVVDNIYTLTTEHSDNEARQLLRDLAAVSAPLKKLVDELRASGDKKVGKIFEITVRDFKWPRLKDFQKVIIPSGLQNWLETADFQHNPFGAEYAEYDPHLTGYTFYPLPALEPETGFLRGARPAVLFAESGMGKTAAARLLAYDCSYPRTTPRELDVFPVYCQLSLLQESTPTNRHALLNFLCRAISLELMKFLALNPIAYFYHKKDSQAAIMQLLSYLVGSGDNLCSQFRQANISEVGLGKRLLDSIQEFGPTPDPIIPPDEYVRLEVLRHARPVGLNIVYLLVDIQAAPANRWEAVKAAQQMQPLFDLTLALESVGIYLKLFVPAEMQPHLTVSMDIFAGTLTWSNAELDQLLGQRIIHASPSAETAIEGVDNFDQLFDPRTTLPGVSPAQRLVACANGSPRRLVHLGNKVLYEHARTSPKLKIDYQTLEDVLRQYNRNSR